MGGGWGGWATFTNPSTHWRQNRKFSARTDVSSATCDSEHCRSRGDRQTRCSKVDRDGGMWHLVERRSEDPQVLGAGAQVNFRVVPGNIHTHSAHDGAPLGLSLCLIEIEWRRLRERGASGEHSRNRLPLGLELIDTRPAGPGRRLGFRPGPTAGPEQPAGYQQTSSESDELRFVSLCRSTRDALARISRTDVVFTL